MRKRWKAVVITAVSILLVAAIVIGIVWVVGRSTDPVKVVRASDVTMSYYDNSQYYDGRVTADNIQSIYLSDSQTITEVLVREGQSVKKGDPLLRYDTTLSDIQLERQKIKVQQTQLSLEQAQKDLARINAMVPYSPPPAAPEPTEPPTEAPVPVDELPYFIGGDGTASDPFCFLWAEELTYDEAFLEDSLQGALEGYFVFEVREADALNGALLAHWGLHVTVRIIDAAEPDAPEESTAPSDAPTEEPPVEETPAAVRKLEYAFFTPVEDSGDVPAEEPDQWTDTSSGYTSSEIAKMRKEKQKEIRDLELSFRMEQVEAERMEAEASGNTLYSKVDGTVTRLIEEETARMEGTPFLTVSGGGCYYVNIAIGEFERESIPLGTTVTVESWMNGMTTAEGTIDSISETPVNGYYNGSGNPNVTLYNAVVAVPADAELMEGSYVSVIMNTNSSEEMIYLPNMFLRNENGRAYIYKRGPGGTLCKTYVQTGAVLWGEYTAVYSGISDEDWIAFPYGKEVRDGAKTVESSADEFYSYSMY